jgi:PAS domain S-box-containing protein
LVVKVYGGKILVKSCELLKARGGLVYLAKEDEGRLNVAAIHNLDQKYLGGSVALGEGVAGLVATTQKPMRLNNYFEWSGKTTLFAGDESITAVLGIPLIANGRVVGVLELMDDWRKHVFTDEDVRLLNLLAPQAAIALSNSLLYEVVTRERDRLHALLNSVNDGILMLDRTYNVVLANQRFGELMELPTDELAGHPITEVADILAETLESDPPFSSDSMNRILRELNRNPSKGFSRKIHISDPKNRYIDWSGAPVLDSNRDTIGWLNVFHDFTQQRELEQLRDDFINMLVHDLKSPLTGVIGGIELAESLFPEEFDEESEIPQQKEFLQMASNNCRSMLSMVNTLLEVSRLEAGRMPLDMKLVTAEDLVSSAVADVELNAREKRIALRKRLPYEPVWLKIDMPQMRRVIMNLLSNSIKFSPEGRDILITVQVEQGVRRRGTTSSLDPLRMRQTATQLLKDRSKEITEVPQKSIVISVADEGPGIPPDDLGRVFNKFVQLPNSRGKVGSGLGLALCKLVVDAHGGRIWAESVMQQGSTFFISLPFIDPDAPHE